MLFQCNAAKPQDKRAFSEPAPRPRAAPSRPSAASFLFGRDRSKTNSPFEQGRPKNRGLSNDADRKQGLFERCGSNRRSPASQASRPNTHCPVSRKDRPIALKRTSYTLGAGGHCRANCSQKRPFTPSPLRRPPSAVVSSCPAKLMLSAAIRHSPSASRTASTS